LETILPDVRHTFIPVNHPESGSRFFRKEAQLSRACRVCFDNASSNPLPGSLYPLFSGFRNPHDNRENDFGIGVRFLSSGVATAP